MAELNETEGAVTLVDESFGLTERSAETLQLIDNLRGLALEADRLINEAKHFLSIEATCPKIINVEDKKVAAERLKTSKNLITALNNLRLEMTRPIDKIKARFTEHFAPYVKQLTGSRDSYDGGIKVFDQEETRKRAEETQRRERIAAQERAKLEAEARAKQAAAEESARKDRERAEELRTQGKAGQAARLESKAESKVAEAEQAGESLRAVASTIEAQPVEDNTKVEGLSGRWDYDGTCEDMLKLATQIVASGGVFPPITLLTVDKKVFKAQATALKEKFEGAYPGCKLIKKWINVSR